MTDKPQTVKINVGVLSPPVREQLRSQGFKVNARISSMVRQAQLDLDAINRLRVRAIITNSVASKAAQRVVDRIARLPLEERDK